MRNPPGAARYRQSVVHKMLQCAGVMMGSSSGAEGAVSVNDSVDGLIGFVAGLSVCYSTLTAPTGASLAAGAPPPPERGAPAVPGPAVVAAGSASAARAASFGAERPAQRASGAGRKSQAVKEQAAKAVQFRKLRPPANRKRAARAPQRTAPIPSATAVCNVSSHPG